MEPLGKWYRCQKQVLRCERPGCKVWTNACVEDRRGYWGTVEIDGVKHVVCSRYCANLWRSGNADSVHEEKGNTKNKQVHKRRRQ
jgi:hypothetical protein